MNTIEHEVVIIGAGPAGIAAATRLRELGVRDIVVLEREHEPGGVPRHCGHRGFGWVEYRRLLTGPQYARRLAAAAVDVEMICRASVTALLPDGVVEVNTIDGPRTLRGRCVLLATGARESPRSARLIGGTRPWGVMTTGALQQFITLQRQRPCNRAVIIGSELVAYSALMTLHGAGARAVAMIEAQSRAVAFPGVGRLVLAALGTRLFTGASAARIIGDARVEGIEIAQRDRRLQLECDAVICSGEFVPEAALLRGGHLQIDAGTGGPSIDQFGRCSDPAYFAAGNLLRAVEASWTVWREGRDVAGAIHAALRGNLPAPDRTRRLLAQSPLRYVCPQFIVAGSAQPAAIPLHACARDPVDDRVAVRAADQVLATRRIHAWAMRRIELPAIDPMNLPAGELSVGLANDSR